jgi:hypothetical protein
VDADEYHSGYLEFQGWVLLSLVTRLYVPQFSCQTSPGLFVSELAEEGKSETEERTEPRLGQVILRHSTYCQ